MTAAPWTELGRVQAEVEDLKRQVRDKGSAMDLDSVSRRLSRLEETVRQAKHQADDTERKVNQLQEDFRLFSLGFVREDCE
jgi:predicted  nucleic acid-binding Zn-ribbon protein